MGNRLSNIQVGLLFEGGLLVLALLLGYFIGPYPVNLWKPTASSLGAGVAGAFALALLFLLLRPLPFAPIKRIFEVVQDFYRSFFKDATPLDLALISIAAGVGEEFLFRGFLQQGLADWINPAAGLIIASVVFGLAHMVTLTYAVLAAISGALLGWLMNYTGDLAAPVLAHALYDFIALMYLRRSLA